MLAIFKAIINVLKYFFFKQIIFFVNLHKAFLQE